MGTKAIANTSIAAILAARVRERFPELDVIHRTYSVAVYGGRARKQVCQVSLACYSDVVVLYEGGNSRILDLADPAMFEQLDRACARVNFPA